MLKPTLKASAAEAVLARIALCFATQVYVNVKVT